MSPSFSILNNELFKTAVVFQNIRNVLVLTLLKSFFIQKILVRQHNFLWKNYQNKAQKHVNIFLGCVEMR